jgi:CelD/BcsL family acetyltransferase involved in cellulose biosynthesis
VTSDEHWALWRRDPRATAFQSPAWIDAWWRELGGGERIEVTARDAVGGLIGALPMTVWHDHGVRRLIPVAAGQSDYSDALVGAASAGEAIAGLWQGIDAVGGSWDEVLLPDLRPDSPLLGTLPDQWIASDEPGEVCPVLALPSEGDVLAAMSRSRRRKIVHDHNRAAALGGVDTQFAGGTAAIDEGLAALFRLHRDRWAREGQAGVLAEERVQRFLAAAAHALDATGLLRLVVVRHEGAIVAVLLGCADGERGMSYINGVDMSVPGQSFGTLAFRFLIDRAHADGAREFHFLRGEEPYKYGWGAVPMQTVRRTIRRR